MAATQLIYVILIPALSGGFPTWTSQPCNLTFVVEGDNLTLNWEYNMNGSFVQAQFSDKKGSGERKAVAVKSSANGNTVVAPAYRDRFLVNMTDIQTSITILRVKKSDHGGYELELINSRLETVTSRVKIAVKYSASIIAISSNQTVNESDVVNLNCTVDGYPPPNITWKKLPENISVSFPIIVTSKRDEGFYRCTSDNGVGKPAYRESLLKVQNFHPVFTKLITSSDDNSVILNEEFNITCTAHASPPAKYRFFREDISIANDTSGSGTFTTFLSGRRTKVDYRCIPFNEYGVGAPDVIAVKVLYRPTSTIFVSVPKKTAVPYGSVLNANCSTDANPKAHTYQIYLNGNLVRNSSSGVFNITVKADGVYTCAPINKVGTGNNASFIVTVVDPPFITMNPRNATVLVGKTARLRCLARGYPEPNITWTRDFDSNGSLLIFHSPKLSDSGWYRCSAENVFGTSTSARAYLDVVESASDIINGRMTIRNEIFEESLQDTNSVRYKTLTQHFVTEVQKVYKNDVTFNTTEVVGYKSGSVIVLFVLKFNEVVRIDKKITVLTTAAEDGQLGAFDVDPTSVLAIKENELPLPSTISTNTRTNKVPEYQPSRPSTCVPPDCIKSCNEPVFGAVIAVLLLIIIGLVIHNCWLRRRRGSERGLKLISGQRTVAAEEIETRDNGISMAELETTVLGVRQNVEQETIQTQNTDLDEETPEPVATYQEHAYTAYDIPPPVSRSCWEVSKENVKVGETIGKGAFSQVAKGIVKDFDGKPGNTVVAVKMLKDKAHASDKKDLLSELEMMMQLEQHPHVIKLLGYVRDPLLVLTEYIPFGDLLGFLRKSRGMDDNYYSNQSYKSQTGLTSNQLMTFAWQIADGMCYLASNSIIHRDLAARNVLVGEGQTCKVTDFGMARDVKVESIYEKKTAGRIPVKWTAYESLFFGTYTTKSDVWSFGVVLYEIFTLGGSPYPGMEGKKVPHWLELGYRMPQPKHIDDRLYQVMLECWLPDPSKRPAFANLRNKLQEMENQHEELLNMTIYDKKLYVNVDDLNV